MNPLAQEINRWIGLPFVWGQTDCCLVLADWLVRALGLEQDPAEHLRYCYDSMASCHRLTGYMRDPVGVVGGICEDVVGLARTATPRRGDIGVVVALAPDGREMSVGAIYTGRSWVTKSPDGMTSYQPLRVLAAWSVGYED